MADNQTFVLEGPLFSAAKKKALLFAYKLSGSSSVSLNVEHRASEANWSSIFSKVGDTGASWQFASIRVPDGTVAVRVLASLSTAEESVKLDSILAVDEVPSLENVTCDFEYGFCDWSAGTVHRWQRTWVETPSPHTGPQEAYEGWSYIYTEANAGNEAGSLSLSLSMSLCPRSRCTGACSHQSVQMCLCECVCVWM